MERLTTDTPKDNFEMALNLFYVKDKEVWVRGYGKGGADISLLNLTREILSHQCPYVEPDISDDDLIMMMPEWLFDDVRATEHVIGLLYQAAWVCAELREHLKQFEDTKRTPEQIEELEAAIMGKAVAQITEFEGMPIDRMRELAEADSDGRVVIQPCKIGDKLYRVFAGEIFEHRVGRMKYFAIQGKWDIETYPFCPCVESSIGKTVFLTREEAEKALAEMEGKG